MKITTRTATVSQMVYVLKSGVTCEMPPIQLPTTQTLARAIPGIAVGFVQYPPGADFVLDDEGKYHG
jgi:hypothetical protein